jgi:hypothetical protein
VLIDTAQMVMDAKETLTSKLLADAYEQRVYGHYVWTSVEGKKFWDVPPVICELIPSIAQKTFCSSPEEFDAFVAKYMEE